MAPGLIIAAPSSGSGKTTVTLGLLRLFRDRGLAVAPVKVGPDYIDPAFHAAASGRACLNIDTWAMRPASLARLFEWVGAEADLVLAEGVMGLFDGAPRGGGSTADLAALTGWPVVLVVDVRGMGASAGAVVRGFLTHRTDLSFAGLIFNRVGGPGHEALLRESCGAFGVPVLGCLPRDDSLTVPSRHLGLVQAAEHGDLDGFLKRAADLLAKRLDIAALQAAARPLASAREEAQPSVFVPPLGQRVAVARDEAFAFLYAHLIEGWRRAGAEVSFFSPLQDEAPSPDADAVYLPGGYPELHGGCLAANQAFLGGLRNAAAGGAAVYGECGGFMVLGRSLVDGDGRSHGMAGLLPVETSVAEPRRMLGYREAKVLRDGPLGAVGSLYRGHEFHFARTTTDGAGLPLFEAWDSQGRGLGPLGVLDGRAFGSFIHLIDRAEDAFAR